LVLPEWWNSHFYQWKSFQMGRTTTVGHNKRIEFAASRHGPRFRSATHAQR